MGISRIVHARRLTALLSVAVALAAPCFAGAIETTFELRPAPAEQAAPPLPPTGVFPVQLVLDDDQLDAVFGVTSGNSAQQFLWFNRFDAPETFSLQEIWVLFPSGAEITVGGPVQLVVYHDPDGDPANGADLVTAFDATVQAADDVTFSLYPLPAPEVITGGGDVLIGVVGRFVQTGVTPPANPAALDTTAPQGRSWFAVWTGDPPDPPLLPGDVLTSPIDPFLAGNWMIRGFGGSPPAQVIPTLGEVGLGVLIGLLALAALLLLRRSARAAGAAIVLLAASAAAPAATAQVVIDDFSTAQAALTVPPGSTASSSVAGAGMIGGTRDAGVELTAGPGPVSFEVTGGDLTFDTTPAGTAAEVVVTWDGDSDPATLDPVGLGGADLTAGGAAAVRLTAGATTNPVNAVVEVFTDGANSSVAGLVVPVGAAQDLVLAFSEFVSAEGVGADFADVGAIVLTLGASEATVTVELLDTVPPALAATKVDALTVDDDGDGLADPGDTLTYTVTITNTGGEAISVDFDDTVDANTTLVGGSVSATPIAENDQYQAVGNVTLDADGTPPRLGLLANDADPDGDPVTVSAIDPTSSGGGSVTLTDASTGTFQYTPAPGFRGVDTFSYTAEDDDGNTDIGLATVLVEGIVWFVDNTNDGCGSPPCGTGTQTDPFETFKQAEAASAAGDIMRIREGDGTDTGHDQGFILKARQRLVGGNADLVIGGELIEAGTGHSVHSHAAGNVLDLAGEHVIEGMRLEPTTGHGMAGTGSSDITVDDVMIYTAGTAGGVSLANHTGGFTFANSMISSTVAVSGVAVEISGGSGSFDFSGSPVANDGGGLLHVQNTTGGATVDFSGSTLNLANGTTDGILLATNAGGATFTFPPIGSITTGNGNGVRIVNSGTVNLDSIGAVDATGGAALDISGTTVAKAGAPGAITVTSLASSGGSVGVNLNSVAPAVTVTGPTTVSGAAGINLQSSGAVTFTGQVGVTSTAGSGIVASNNGLVSVPTGTSTVSATGGPALDVANTQLAMTFASLSSTGSSSTGVSLVGASGTVTATGGSITGGSSGTAFHVDGGTPTVSYAGTVTQTNVQRVVNVEDTTGGTVSFTAKVTGGAASTGVRVHNADGNTSFADLDLGTSGSPMTSTALTLSGGSTGTHAFADTQIFTTGAAGISASNGGTVEVTGAGNRVTASSATAVVLQGGTTVGAGGATFERIDSNNATHGIRLLNTGSAGTFAVTGAPGAAATECGGSFPPSSATCSGGIIQNQTMHGIELDTVTGASFAYMHLEDANTTDGGAAGNCDGNTNTNCRAAVKMTSATDIALDNVSIDDTEEIGISGETVTNFDLSDSVIQNAGNATDEHGLYLRNLLGTSSGGSVNTISNTIVDGSSNFNLFVQNDTATNPPGGEHDRLEVSGSTFRNTPIATTGGDGITFSGRSASNMKLLVSDSVLTNNATDGAQCDQGDTGAMECTFTGNTVNSNNIGLNMSASGTASLRFDISNNVEINSRSGGAQVVNVFAGANSTVHGRIQDNDDMDTLSTNATGIDAIAEGSLLGGTARLVLLVDDNTIDVSSVGINGRASQGTAGNTGELHITVTDNTVNSNNIGFGNDGIEINSGSSAGGTGHKVCLNITGNTVTGGGVDQDIKLRQRVDQIYNIQGLGTMGLCGGSNCDGTVEADVATYVGALNTATRGLVDITIGGSGFGEETCQTPTLPGS